MEKSRNPSITEPSRFKELTGGVILKFGHWASPRRNLPDRRKRGRNSLRVYIIEMYLRHLGLDWGNGVLHI